MKTEHLKDGPVTYSQTEAMVALAEKWLLDYFAVFGPRRPGDFEDDFCGEPSNAEVMMRMHGRWRDSPFYPALGRLIDKGLVRWRQVEDGDVWYALSGPLPMAELVPAMLAAPAVGDGAR